MDIMGDINRRRGDNARRKRESFLVLRGARGAKSWEIAEKRAKVEEG